METDKFCLRWNDFEANLGTAFRELREEASFFDVTLTCDDEQVQAHKLILSACSPFFRKVFQRNPQPNPILYLRGVKFESLEAILNFVYHGEVNVAQEDLNSFLQVAEDLKVKGLTQNNSKVKNSSANPTPKKSLEQNNLPFSIPMRCDPPTFTLDDEVQEILPVKPEPKDSLPPQTSQSISQDLVLPHHIQPDDSSLDLVCQDDGYDDFGQYEQSFLGDANASITSGTGESDYQRSGMIFLI